jgi:hypothetical protein
MLKVGETYKFKYMEGSVEILKEDSYGFFWGWDENQNTMIMFTRKGSNTCYKYTLEVPAEKRYFNVYKYKSGELYIGQWYRSLEDAKNTASDHCVGRVVIELKEGVWDE